MIRNGVRFASLALTVGALGWLAWHGVFPQRNPLHPNEHIIAEDQLTPHQWRRFLGRQDVQIALTYFFVVSGATTVLPSDFNTASNTINAIGSGAGGGGADSGSGGGGGGGGEFSSIVNYAGHSAGQTVNVQVGAGDTFFDTTAILLAKTGGAGADGGAGGGGAGGGGGLASSGVGTVKFSGGGGGTGGTGIPGSMCSASSDGTGAGAGGAAGPHGIGNNGADGTVTTTTAPGGAGGVGDAGNTAAGANGTQFNATHGSGGGGAGGAGTATGSTGGAGGGGGSYGGGGGGGGPGATVNGAGGNAFQGLIAIAYTPSGGGGARSFGFIIS